MDKLDLLKQATAAIVAPGPAGRDETIGTAWLAMAPRHLLTAGHVVQGRSKVTVQFEDEEPQPADVVLGPFIDDDRGVDVAVLALLEETSREPLPIVLVDRPQGDVIVAGYGHPNAQSVEIGTYLRPYTRNHRSENYLLEYASRALTATGFSGGAVYSLTRQAVVGLQIEASNRTGQVLAMPLSRIPQHWKEIQTIANRSLQGLCVLLEQETTDLELVGQIIAPTLEGLGLELYRSSIGATTVRDLAKIDRADVLIAEADAADPAVTRELTIAQGLGTPDVLIRAVRRATPTADLPDAPLVLDLDDPASARSALTERLNATLAVFNAVGEIVATNPITGFFGAPLTRVSAANALALGYFQNFVAPVGRLLLEASRGNDITITVDGAVVDPRVHDRILLHVVLPEHLAWATDREIRRRIERDGSLVDAVISAPDLLSRSRTLKAVASSVEKRDLVLVDVFPTTMSTMIESITERFQAIDEADRDPHLWAAIERKEIDRFDRTLSRRLRDDPPGLRDLSLADVVVVTTAAQTFPSIALGQASVAAHGATRSPGAGH